MTDTDKTQGRIRLAEFDGWKFKTEDDGSLYFFNLALNRWEGIDNDPKAEPSWYIHLLPDYFNDLNAVRRLLSKLNQQQQERFGEEMWTLVPEEICDLNPAMGYFIIANATAAQYCEALLRILK